MLIEHILPHPKSLHFQTKCEKCVFESELERYLSILHAHADPNRKKKHLQRRRL